MNPTPPSGRVASNHWHPPIWESSPVRTSVPPAGRRSILAGSKSLFPHGIPRYRPVADSLDNCGRAQSYERIVECISTGRCQWRAVGYRLIIDGRVPRLREIQIPPNLVEAFRLKTRWPAGVGAPWEGIEKSNLFALAYDPFTRILSNTSDLRIGMDTIGNGTDGFIGSIDYISRYDRCAMAHIDANSIFKKIGEDRARMEAIGITEDEMVRYYNSCGAQGDNQKQAFASLVAKLKLSEADAEFADEVLGNCAPF